MIAVKFQVMKAISDLGTVKSNENDWCYLLKDTEGWVPATSCKVNHAGSHFYKIPKDIYVFPNKEAAAEFMQGWMGHPWYNVPNGVYEFVEVVPRMVQDGWKLP